MPEYIPVDLTAIRKDTGKVEITLSLSGSNISNQLVNWYVIDPDDPADDQTNVDPNGPDGDDNGYLGSGEDSLPVKLATFHNEAGDSIATSYTNFEGKSLVWMKIYPDDVSGYHPGDNYLVSAVAANDTFSREIFTRKRMKIEYDYMNGCNLPDTAWWMVKQIYAGYNLDALLNYNRLPYVNFNKDTIHLKESESNLSVEVFNSVTEIYPDFWNTHRNKSDSLNFPFYIVGACSVTTELAQQHPELAGLGATFFMIQGLKKRPLISIVWTPWAKDYPSGWPFPITADSVDLFVGCVAAHELGHYGARLVDYEEDPNEHYSSDCLMNGLKDPGLTIMEPRFCYICIYRYRGNMYIEGDPIFYPNLNRRFK